MAAMKPEIANVIESYQAAFLAANGHPISIEYERGWFRIRSGGSYIGTRHRRKEVEGFTATLLSRSKLRHGQGSQS